MAGVRIKDLQDAKGLLEQFDQMQFAVDTVMPDTTQKLSGKSIKDAIGVPKHIHPQDEVQGLPGALEKKLDKAGGTVTGNLTVQGNTHVKNIKVDEFLDVPELRYNRVDVTVGDRWRSPGGGLIEHVDTESQTVYLKLEEGEMGSIAPGDICMGVFHSSDPRDNATSDYDDSRGNRRFTGFYTVYFAITEILDEQKSSFRYEQRPVSPAYPKQFHPSDAMTFVAYGNFSFSDRRTAVYETRTYQRFLKGVNDWEFDESNIAAQFGDLSNLAVHGLQLEGYSAYLNNVYTTGVINQIREEMTPAGPWVNTFTPYRKGSIITFDRAAYIAKQDTSNPPAWMLQSGDDYLQSGDRYLLAGNAETNANTEEWMLLSPPPVDGQDGATGATGPTGKTGATGPAGKNGSNGTNGMIVRTSEWASGVAYRNDQTSTATIRYMDVVTVSSGNSQRIFRCKTSHTSGSSLTTANASYWEEMNNMSPIYTPLIMAQNAVLRFMQGQEIVVQNNGGTIVGGLSGKVSNDRIYPIYAGSSVPYAAPFRVDQYGQLTATNAVISGQINATSGSFTGKVTATSGSFTGTVNASSGTFSGTVKTSNLTATGGTMQNVSFKSSNSGQRIEITSGTGELLMYDGGGVERVRITDGTTEGRKGPQLIITHKGTRNTRVFNTGHGIYGYFENDSRVYETVFSIVIGNSVVYGNYPNLSVILKGLPTYNTGVSGMVWRDGTTLRIVP